MVVHQVVRGWAKKGTFTPTSVQKGAHLFHFLLCTRPCMLPGCGDLVLPSVLLVISECIHQQPLLYELLPLGVLHLQVTVVVVGHNDAVRVEGQLDNVAVIIAHHPLTVHAAGRRVHKDLLPLQLVENMLIYGTMTAVFIIVYYTISK